MHRTLSRYRLLDIPEGHLRLAMQASQGIISENVTEVSAAESVAPVASTPGNGVGGAEAVDGKPVRASLQRKLTEALQPQEYALYHVSIHFMQRCLRMVPCNTIGDSAAMISLPACAAP